MCLKPHCLTITIRTAGVLAGAVACFLSAYVTKAETGALCTASFFGFALCFGLMIGVVDCILTVLFADLFGRPHLGEIMGIVNGVMLVANASSALLFGAAASSMVAATGALAVRRSNATGNATTTGEQGNARETGQEFLIWVMGVFAAMFLLLATLCVFVPSPEPQRGGRNERNEATVVVHDDSLSVCNATGTSPRTGCASLGAKGLQYVDVAPPVRATSVRTSASAAVPVVCV
jgi:hypothetical protein